MTNANLDPLFSSAKTGGTDDWATPQWLLDKIAQETNHHRPFMLDPCASAENAKCVKFYTEADDGLIQPWAKYRSIFINPPYSQIKKWVKKTYEESQLFPNDDQWSDCVATLLIPARTDTTWWHDYIVNAAQIFFLRGRVKFGTSKNSAPFPSAVVSFRNERVTCVPKVQFVDWRPQ